MKIVQCWEEEGIAIPFPYERQIKVLFAPDKKGVEELTFSQALIPVGSQTDYHTHDRGELIYVVQGEGVIICEGKKVQIKEDVAMWIPKGEKHQIKNTGEGLLKLATVFVPPYTAEENYERCLKAVQLKAEGSDE